MNLLFSECLVRDKYLMQFCSIHETVGDPPTDRICPNYGICQDVRGFWTFCSSTQRPSARRTRLVSPVQRAFRPKSLYCFNTSSRSSIHFNRNQQQHHFKSLQTTFAQHGCKVKFGPLHHALCLVTTGEQIK